MPADILNTDGLSDADVKVLRDIFNKLKSMGATSVITDDMEVQQLTAELSSASVNLFDGYTQFQNILKYNDIYIFHVKSQARYITSKGVQVVLSSYHYYLIAYGQLQDDYGKCSIEPGETQSGLIKLLSHIFSSDEVIVSGHDLFNSKYQVHASDKAKANSLLSDSLLNACCKCDNTHISISHNKAVVLYPEITEESVCAAVEVFSCLKHF